MATPSDTPAARNAARLAELTAELTAVRSTLHQVREVAFNQTDPTAMIKAVRQILGENWEHTSIPGRMFDLIRSRDVSGKSGEGAVAEGFVFEDGTVAMRWRSNRASTNIYASVDDVIEVHGHGGSTELVFR